MKRRYFVINSSYESELCHEGIKGMHWGVRNGPPYPLNKSDMSADERREASESKGSIFDQDVKGGKDKPNKSRAEVITKSTQEAIKSTEDLVDIIADIAGKKKGKSAEGLTDQQLRDQINRLNLEKQYSQLTQEELSKGWKVAKAALRILGSVAAVAVPVSSVAANVHMIRKLG